MVPSVWKPTRASSDPASRCSSNDSEGSEVHIVHPVGLVTRNIHVNATGGSCCSQQKILGREGEARQAAQKNTNHKKVGASIAPNWRRGGGKQGGMHRKK